MESRKKVVLIGAGGMGRNHLRVLLADTQFHLVAIVDPSPSVRIDNLPEDVAIFFDCKFLLNIEFDCAIVATPTSTHFALLQELLTFGKPILVEKPVTATFQEAKRLKESMPDAVKLLCVGHVERHNPVVQRVKEIIDHGILGKPIHFNITRIGGSPRQVIGAQNVLLDLAVHDLDVLTLLVGPLKVMSAFCHSSIQSGVFDTAEIHVASHSGVTASIHANWITPTKIRTLRVTGTRGMGLVDYMLQSCTVFGGKLLDRHVGEFRNFDDHIAHYALSDKIEFGIRREEPLKMELLEFYKRVCGLPSSICSYEEGARTVYLAEQALDIASKFDNVTN